MKLFYELKVVFIATITGFDSLFPSL